MTLLYAELGAIINFIAVVVGAGLGLLFKRGIPERIRDTLTKAMFLSVIFIGITGLSKGENALITILSMGIGAFIGEAIDIDKHLNRFADFLQDKLAPVPKTSELGVKLSGGARVNNRFAEGFITCTLVFAVGAMAIVGSFESATGDHTILFSKSVIDAVTCCMFATTLGIGCMLSAFPVAIYEAILIGIFYAVGSALPTATVNEITCVGSILIISLGTNLLGITRIKVANLIPAMFLPILLCLIPWSSFM